MSASKILEKLQRKGQMTALSKHQEHPEPENGKFVKPPCSEKYMAALQEERVVDPVVARLKAARKAEKELKEKELRERKGLTPKKYGGTRSKPPIKLSNTISPRSASSPSKKPAKNGHCRPGNGRFNRPSSPALAGSERRGKTLSTENKPQMTFSQLMVKALGIDQSKMSIEIRQKTKPPEATPPISRRKAGDSNEPRYPVLGLKRPILQTLNPMKSVGVKPKARQIVQTRAPLPVRKPSLALEAKLKQKPVFRNGTLLKAGKRPEFDDNSDATSEHEESDMDSFIASEDEKELQVEQDYDRDEIWSIFNRGKKRSLYSYDDDDSDDMEATGAEILEEENRSKRNALLEDKREMEKEAKLAALKKARKSQRTR